MLMSLTASAATDNAAHLRGIHFLYMYVDTSMATGIQQTERLDLNDIMELQLRRGQIELRPYVLNQPERNVPVVELIVDTSRQVNTGEFELILRVRDYVTIDRNKEKTVATIFELRRTASGGPRAKDIDVIKAELRDLMSEFVSILQAKNS